MNDALSWAAVPAEGLLLGAAFFGGLWWTIRRAVVSPRPALWFFTSLPLRMSIALAGFYFVGHGSWQRLLLCLLGFMAARIVITRLSRPSAEARHRMPGEAIHAP